MLKKLVVGAITTGIMLSSAGGVLAAEKPSMEKNKISNFVQPRDTTATLGLDSTYYMTGSRFSILYGSNVVSLSGNKVTTIGEGTAQVAAYKANGDLNGVYTFVVKR
ncbi:hypothetical protein [Bacillus sp. IBL03825]|uniref:hypothetical protein n=1 Tax=Bacillus sp. IBL03825 TaxID=2953580 RepID=UPI0021577304|nr:hypothetical protein [Bacillus sp. IBL03825]MCR6850514.1 hypothetical protein [Bacillus sp. IBL03825]